MGWNWVRWACSCGVIIWPVPSAFAQTLRSLRFEIIAPAAQRNDGSTLGEAKKVPLSWSRLYPVAVVLFSAVVAGRKVFFSPSGW